VLPKVDDIEDFYKIGIRKRILFSLGGPAANFIAAYFLLMILHLYRNGFGGDILITPLFNLVMMTVGIFLSYGILFKDPSSMSGAVGMVSQGGAFVGSSFVNLLVFTTFLSISLALFNLLPIPALDGGKILFAAMEKVSKRTRKLQLPVTVASILFLILLMGFTTLIDIARLSGLGFLS
jgi:regulator of sigma E protease